MLTTENLLFLGHFHIITETRRHSRTGIFSLSILYTFLLATQHRIFPKFISFYNEKSLNGCFLQLSFIFYGALYLLLTAFLLYCWCTISYVFPAFREVILNNSVPLLQMLSQSDIATIVILAILAVMSLGSWGIIIVKYVVNRKNQRANVVFFREFVNVRQFVELQGLCETADDSALRSLTSEVLKEASKFSNFVSYDSIQHRASLLEDTIPRSIEGLRLTEDRYLGFLATCSNLAPFFGLLGTVWGIMVAFFQIGQHGSADLTVVAPGIAMALITTVGGLVVAIPASAGYNYFTARNGQNEISYFNFGSQVLSLFKRGDLLALEEVAG